jgi:carbohydrate kinase (thermoresistant glucokinase family)
MGVTGSGKTTVGLRLADEMHAEFADGDDFHSPDAVAKMSQNVPLTDDDRWPWLERVGEWLAAGDSRIVACSALKRAYRDAIRVHAPDALFVHLRAPQATLEARVARRARKTGHFAGPGLLDSQYAILEGLEDDERGASIDIRDANPVAAALIARAAIEMAPDA